jgi:hypothetical protein
MKRPLATILKATVFTFFSFAVAIASGSTVFAQDGKVKNRKYISECREAAVLKLRALAFAKQLALREESVEVEAIDDRWYNSNKFVWFKATGLNEQGVETEIGVLTQKSFMPPKRCF